MTVLANVYIPGGRSVAWRSGPGRTIPFRGGHARIIDERDMPTALKIEGGIVDVPRDQIDWVPRWVSMLSHGERPKAEIRVPEGFVVGPDYKIVAVHEDSEPMEEPTAPVASDAKRRGRPPKDGWEKLLSITE